MKPYETIQELLEDVKIHGPYVQSKYNNSYYLATQIYPVGIENEADFLVILDSNPYNTMSPLELFEQFTWQDGSPCGKKGRLNYGQNSIKTSRKTCSNLH